jgi:hypothetical protein
MGQIEIEAQGGGEYRARIGSYDGATTVLLTLGDADAVSDGRLADDEATARATVAYLLGHQEAEDLPPAVDLGDVVAAYPDAVERISGMRG